MAGFFHVRLKALYPFTSHWSILLFTNLACIFLGLILCKMKCSKNCNPIKKLKKNLTISLTINYTLSDMNFVVEGLHRIDVKHDIHFWSIQKLFTFSLWLVCWQKWSGYVFYFTLFYHFVLVCHLIFIHYYLSVTFPILNHWHKAILKLNLLFQIIKQVKNIGFTGHQRYVWKCVIYVLMLLSCPCCYVPILVHCSSLMLAVCMRSKCFIGWCFRCFYFRLDFSSWNYFRSTLFRG